MKIMLISAHDIMHHHVFHLRKLNTLWPENNGCHNADVFKCIFCCEFFSFLIKISRNHVPEGVVDNIFASLQVMVWHITNRRTNIDKDLWCHMVSLGRNELKHMYRLNHNVTFNSLRPTWAIIGSYNGLSPIVNWTLGNKLQLNCIRNSNIFIHEIHFNMSSGKCWPFCLGLNVSSH